MRLTKLFAALTVCAVVAFSSCKPKDEDIQKSIDEKIAASAEMAGCKAAVKDGIATLTGQVKDDACKAMCEKTINDIKGVKSVVNNCTAMPPVVIATPAADDASLLKGVTDALKDLAGAVKAEVKDGVVTLTGAITKDKLGHLMQTLTSLHPKKIDNKLTVK